MASIGPQLPPHLQKRKRTPEDETDLSSPPPKTSRRDNEDEIALDDDSDDDFGPSVPQSVNKNSKAGGPTSQRAAIGPSLPPPSANSSSSSSSAPADTKRSIGPSLPPPTATAPPPNTDEIPLDADSDSDAAGSAPPAPPPERVLGPAPPPAPLAERPPTGSDPNDSSASDDDDWGPALPGTTTSSSSHRPLGSLPAPTHPSGPSTASTAPKRDDWMLAPPPSSGPSSARAPDPTKLRARKFATGPRAATEAKPAGGSGVSSIWTETPEEKARRLANAVLGREDPRQVGGSGSGSGGSGGGGGRGCGSGSESGSTADEARIRAFTEQTRGRSLVEEHQAARAAGKASASAGAAAAARSRAVGESNKWGGKSSGHGDEAVVEEEDDPSKRAFDWEKDMKVGGRITNAQRKELLNRAANFGGRFQSGKYL